MTSSRRQLKGERRKAKASRSSRGLFEQARGVDAIEDLLALGEVRCGLPRKLLAYGVE